MDKSTAKLFVETFFTPDFDVREMIEKRTARYLNFLLYTRGHWQLVSGDRYWGHLEIFEKVTKGLDAMGVKYKTELKAPGWWHIYIYVRQSKEVNALSHAALDSNPDCNDMWRNKLRACIK